MGVGAGLYMCDVVKKVHVRNLISWWVLVIIIISNDFATRPARRPSSGRPFAAASWSRHLILVNTPCSQPLCARQ